MGASHVKPIYPTRILLESPADSEPFLQPPANSTIAIKPIANPMFLKNIRRVLSRTERPLSAKKVIKKPSYCTTVYRVSSKASFADEPWEEGGAWSLRSQIGRAHV